MLRTANLDGDEQADLRVHGGPGKAVCVYSADHYPAWRQELGLASMEPGAFGENFTVSGHTESDVCIGDIYRIHEAIVVVSQPRTPCWKLARRWNVPDLPRRFLRSGRTGWYLRVAQEGHVQRDAVFELLARPYPKWTIAHVNEVTYRVGAAVTSGHSP
jgi:MOSC domain-containing protein YiiM